MNDGRKLTASALAIAIVLAGSAVAVAKPTKRFAAGSDTGTNPVASAAGQAKEPRKIYAVVKSWPKGNQIGAKYTTNCAKDANAGTRGGEFGGKTPVKKKLRMRFKRPDVCQGSILARMKGKGKVKVVLRAR